MMHTGLTNATIKAGRKTSQTAKRIAAVNTDHNERRCPPLCLGAKPSIVRQSPCQSDGFAVDTTVPPIAAIALVLIPAISPQTPFALKLTC